MARDNLIKCVRIARDHHGGHPNGAWSTGEKLAVAVAVALVLDDLDYIQVMGYTALEAAVRCPYRTVSGSRCVASP